MSVEVYYTFPYENFEEFTMYLLCRGIFHLLPFSYVLTTKVNSSFSLIWWGFQVNIISKFFLDFIYKIFCTISFAFLIFYNTNQLLFPTKYKPYMQHHNIM